MEDEQIHPLHDLDKSIIDALIVKDIPEDLDFINLARLLNRYQNFPGEKDLKNDLEKILKFWKISQEELCSKTRLIWSNNFRPTNSPKDLIGSGFDTSN
tara:strand:+ start:209 stop:505 length:297 start_codon:yes stop_codon:yes gene_type:complete